MRNVIRHVQSGESLTAASDHVQLEDVHTTAINSLVHNVYRSFVDSYCFRVSETTRITHVLVLVIGIGALLAYIIFIYFTVFQPRYSILPCALVWDVMYSITVMHFGVSPTHAPRRTGPVRRRWISQDEFDYYLFYLQRQFSLILFFLEFYNCSLYCCLSGRNNCVVCILFNGP